MKRFTHPAVDCHQHRWPAALVERLRGRPRPPRLDGETLHLSGEPPFGVTMADHDPQRRAAENRAAGLDLVLTSLSSPLGIETLPPDEAAPLLAAWHSCADDLDPSRERIWAAPALVEPDLDALGGLLGRRSVCGLQVPATAMATPEALDRLLPVLAVAEASDRPVLVHPGPIAEPTPGVPGWWPAVTTYPQQQAAAWHSWRIAGRASLPRLRIGFVALAGLAPLHHERMAQRGSPLGTIDRNVFYETSSYGPQAIDALTRVAGVDGIVHGSDRPYAASTDPGLGDAFARLWLHANPHRFLQGDDTPW